MVGSLVLAAQDHLLARHFVLHTIHFIAVSIGSILAAIVCAIIAATKGRNPLGWGLLGLFFSCITLIVVIFIPSKR